MELNKSSSFDFSKIKVEYYRASGPGGQNKNKVFTAARIRLNLYEAGLSHKIIDRIKEIAPSKITSEGILLISASNFRTQERNRKEAINKLISLVELAGKERKKRKATKITKAVKEKRLKVKKIKSELKKTRQKTTRDLE